MDSKKYYQQQQQRKKNAKYQVTPETNLFEKKKFHKKKIINK